MACFDGQRYSKEYVGAVLMVKIEKAADAMRSFIFVGIVDSNIQTKDRHQEWLRYGPFWQCHEFPFHWKQPLGKADEQKLSF
jgi:hypothetical protein